jgi:hypothetical protein
VRIESVRAEPAGHAQGFRGAGAYTEETITDLIADLYHYAQSENVDVEAVARQAMAHFKAELVADLSDRTIPNAFPPA